LEQQGLPVQQQQQQGRQGGHPLVQGHDVGHQQPQLLALLILPVLPTRTLTCQVQQQQLHDQQQQHQELRWLASLHRLPAEHSSPAHNQLLCSRSRSSLVQRRCCVLSCTCHGWTEHKQSSGSVRAVLCGSSSSNSSTLILDLWDGCQLLLLLLPQGVTGAVAARTVALQQQQQQQLHPSRTLRPYPQQH
jgi:hypothetical protein